MKISLIVQTICGVILLALIYIAFVMDDDNNYQEGLSTNDIIKRAKKTITKETIGKTTKIIQQSEKRLLNKMDDLVKKSTQPLEKQIQTVSNNIKKEIKSIISNIKKAIVDPILYLFIAIGQIGLLLTDLFMLVIKKIISLPACMLSYATSVLYILQTTIFNNIIPLIIRKIFPTFISLNINKIISFTVNTFVAVLSSISHFLGISNFFYAANCFDFVEEANKIFGKISTLTKQTGSNFKKKFGKF